MTDETRNRFLAAIARQLPADRVNELHLFGAIRQGGVESGVAVIALELAPVVTLDVDGGYIPPADVAEAAALETPDEMVVHDQLVDEAAFVADETVADEMEEDIAEDVEVPAPPPAPAKRYTIYTARYRHTLKGLDRGKWEVSVTEEADAPLLTVDAVVRGVQRRSGDVDETVRISGDEFRATLPPTA
ncbi:MAG: hypothetical protein ABIY52_16550 [Gemmatimonadaceae bacterium]